MTDGTELDRGRALITAFFADGVAIFWCISGFFMYEKYSYIHTLKRTLKNVVLPLFLFSVFVFFFGEHELGLGDIIHSIFIWENPFVEHVQLWYLYIYILLMIFSPIVYAFIQYLKEDKERIKWFMLISFVFLVLNDISNNELAVFSHHTWNALIPAMILMVWGNIIYSRLKDTTLSLKHAGVAAGIFVVCNLLRWGIQLIRNSIGIGGIHIYFWFTSIALVNVICVIVFVFAILHNKKKDKRLGRTINSLSSYTFMIYILHMQVYICLKKLINVDDAYKVLCDFLPMGEGFVSECLYAIVIIPLVFVLSLLLGIVLRKIKDVTLKCINKVTNERE